MLKVGGFSLLAEAVVRKADDDSHRGRDAEGAALREYSRSGYGFFVQAGLMLTDHLEIAARTGHMFAFDDTDPTYQDLVDQQGNEFTGGFSYYINRHYLKLQADYSLRCGAEIADGQHFIRAQIDASF